MKKTIVVCGYGPGISDAVARKFGKEGFQVAIVARTREKLEAAAARLRDEGIAAKAFPCDLGNPDQVKALFGEVESALGPATVVHWNPYVFAAGDLLSCTAAELAGALSVVQGLVAAAQAAVPKMKKGEGAILVTGGGFGYFDENIDKMVVQFNAMGLGVANAAKHKTMRLLHQKLAPEGIYVGEVTVLATVKGTAFDSGSSTLEPAAVADAFWKMHQDRGPLVTTIR
jgi:NAD(P)-dependent dehydrogenase (short-subunit alcohol dehydrogenase family)